MADVEKIAREPARRSSPTLKSVSGSSAKGLEDARDEPGRRLRLPVWARKDDDRPPHVDAARRANGGNPAGFVVSLPEGNVYFACDTGLFSDMRLIGACGLALAALPIGDNYTMGPDDALEAVRLLAPRRVVPVHNKTWPLIDQDADAWAARVRAETAAEPLVIQPGATISL